MNLRDVTPIPPLRVDEGQDPWLPGLVRALLLRAQFSRAAARILGWRGIRPSLACGDSLTCRVAGPPGVFGLLFEEESGEVGRVQGTFSLHYFPHPEEPRTEMFPLLAASLATRPAYWDMVREFPARPETMGPFQIAEIRIGAALGGEALWLGLRALSRQRTVAVDGICLPSDPARFVVPPGEVESDVATYGLAMHFFTVLAATATNVLAEPPVGLRLDIRPGWVSAFTSAGEWERRAKAGIGLLDLELDYGKPACGQDDVDEEARAQSRRIDWRAGEPLRRFRNQPWFRAHRPDWTGEEGGDQAGRPDRPELLVLTGFLGSGKTTLLRGLIEFNLQRDRFVAIIQNEIGEIGLDGKLLDHDYSVVEMDEGCVCCSLSGQLKRGLAQILDRFRPDLVVLETSGLANPKNLLAEMDEVRDLVRPGAVVTVADGASVEAALAESVVAREQIEAADILVLNKIDLLSRGQIAQARERLTAINGRMLLIEAAYGDIPFGLLFEPEPQPGWKPGGGPGPLPRYGDIHPTHGADGFTPLTLRLDAPVPAERLSAFLRDAGQMYFRVKGVVDVAGESMPRLVQAVAGRVETSVLPEPGTAERFLVFIGRGLTKDAERLRQALTGE